MELNIKNNLIELLNKKKFLFKFNIQIIYCFKNYSYFSADTLNIDLKEIKSELKRHQQQIEEIKNKQQQQFLERDKKQNQMQEQIDNLIKQSKDLKDEINSINMKIKKSKP